MKHTTLRELDQNVPLKDVETAQFCETTKNQKNDVSETTGKNSASNLTNPDST